MYLEYEYQDICLFYINTIMSYKYIFGMSSIFQFESIILLLLLYTVLLIELDGGMIISLITFQLGGILVNTN